jgi:predicted ATPase/DNA-binding winged helix-turn-helix (wHTH) protein/exonuclease VII small subunit
MPLGARAVAVLSALVERANDYVPKASIMDAAWPGVVVEESNLAVQISAIRHVLAQTPGGEHWIETLPRRGYRFVGPVTEIRDKLPKGGAAGIQRSNLPEPLTSFVGRERELVEIKRLLPGKRLLTLVGVGGIGKTRLALQVAAEVMDAYRDGVWLVDLAPLVDPTLVPSALAQALGASESAGRPLIETLCNHLKGRQLLLLLDNCEHLLDACATLADAILRSAAGTTIIATSREPLHLAGEQTYSLPTLSLPDPTGGTEAVERSEAVQLFMERAQRQQAGFALTSVRAPVVAQLCIHLDGIPLALELAAARIRSLSIEQINARLDNRFRLLTGGPRMALPRQQTLRATLDWSYDLLAEQERTVLRRLAIFPSSFTLEAASSIVSHDTIDEYAVIDLLSQLVARSLVIADAIDARVRYRLLETTRAYAMEKLVEAGETEAITLRHAQCFRTRFERAHDDWLRMTDANWRAIYLPELDSVRAALDWCLGAGGEPAIAIALAGASGAVWADLSLLREGRQWLEAAIARVDAKTPQADQARLWLWLGMLWSLVAPTRAVAAFEQAVDLYRRLGNDGDLGYALTRWASMLSAMGRFEESASILAEALPVLERAGMAKALASYFNGVAFLKRLTGDLASARIHFEKALTLYQDVGADREALAMRSNLADVTWALGDLDAALAGFRETAALLRKTPLTSKGTPGMCLTNLAGVYTERGELDEALAAAREGLPRLKDIGCAWIGMDHVALRAALAGKLANAARLAGYVDSTYTAKESSRGSNEARARDRLHFLLRDRLAPEELNHLLADGATINEDEACRLALEE